METLSKGWKRGFEVAGAASLLSNAPTWGAKMGAALFSGSKLLSVGCNTYNKTSPFTNDFKNGSTHAEISAMLRRRYYDKSSNLILYIYRTTTNARRTIEKNACSRPCHNCMREIISFGIRRIRFFDENGFPTELKI